MRHPARSVLALAAALTLGSAPAAAQRSFDHSAFGRLLQQHVRNGMVDYDAFETAPEFKSYLRSLAAFDPRKLPRDEQLAFWINAYNAYTIELINRHGERKSIRNINKSIGFIKGYGPWNEKLAAVGDSVYGLDHIEQKIIRPEFKEPRIHFALVCAAMGCPPLRREAYTGERLDRQLDEQARTFLLRSPAKNRVDVAARTVHLSEVFKFRDYEKDFGGSEEAIARYIARFHPEGPEKALLQSGDFRVKYTKYDWTLNSQEQAAQALKS
ncbi:MAG: DUF547 domain-containing protein [Gemmatimonadales bacterium]|nr:DUF547 domain-containing protein [Gemmatimonadales bacterium]